MDTGSAVLPVAGERLPDEVLSLLPAEVAGGKRPDWKVLPHGSKAAQGAKVEDGRVYVRSGTSETMRLIGRVLKGTGT